jgi:aromatic ring-opening dioxygenase catalytic subunit (LigB family)
MTTQLPTFFISHGGGPWPWMDEALHGPYVTLAAALRRMPQDAGGQPRAMLMISAHWEAPAFTVQGHPHPSMVYDYYGFPEHTYRVRYPAAGDPALAQRVLELLQAASLPGALDAERGYDHGMFAPMAVAWPNADLPTVQLSLLAGLDPSRHLALGRALAPLRSEGVLIVGSGLSYHNLRAFGPAARVPSQRFDAWLQDVLARPPGARSAALVAWEQAPSARQAHPREEHLLPLMVAVGAAEDEAVHPVYHEDGFMGGVTASSFRFGPSADR